MAGSGGAYPSFDGLEGILRQLAQFSAPRCAGVRGTGAWGGEPLTRCQSLWRELLPWQYDGLFTLSRRWRATGRRWRSGWGSTEERAVPCLRRLVGKNKLWAGIEEKGGCGNTIDRLFSSRVTDLTTNTKSSNQSDRRGIILQEGRVSIYMPLHGQILPTTT